MTSSPRVRIGRSRHDVRMNGVATAGERFGYRIGGDAVAVIVLPYRAGDTVPRRGEATAAGAAVWTAGACFRSRGTRTIGQGKFLSAAGARGLRAPVLLIPARSERHRSPYYLPEVMGQPR